MLNILWISFKLGSLHELTYRTNLIINAIQALLSLLVSLGGLAIIFSHTQTLAGWQPAELLAIVGVYFIIGALMQMIIRPSMLRLMQDVRSGTLDFTLVKPVDAQLLVSISQIQIWKVIDLGIGFLLLGAATSQMGIAITIESLMIFVIALTAGAAIVYSVYLMLATTTFWLVRVENTLSLFHNLYEAGRWPINLYPSWLRVILTFIIPVAFAVTLPAEALSNRLRPEHLLAEILLAGILLITARIVWKFGLKNYTGASA